MFALRLRRRLASTSRPLFALLLFAATLLQQGCTRTTAESAPVIAFVAASFAAPVEAIVAARSSDVDQKLFVNAAASSTLAKQVEAGARADIFVSANRAWMEFLAERGLLELNRASIVARNRLVIVGLDGADRIDIAAPGRVAIADPDHVPLGIYSKQALESLGRWSSWSTDLLTGLNARATVEYVLRGEATLGVIYRSDVVPPLRILEEIKPTHHDPIEIWVAPLIDARAGADSWIDLLTDEAARQILIEHRFIVTRYRSESWGFA